MQAAIFYIAGAAALGSAVAVVLQRNPFLAALALILHLASLATLYLVLQAAFVAAAQVLVYAGAVMIMFLFVIAYLGERAELQLRGGGLTAWVAGIAGAAILIETFVAVNQSSSLLGSPGSVSGGFGSPAEVGRRFLTDYLLAFEIVSIVLLVGAVAGVVLGAARLSPGGRDPLALQRDPVAGTPAGPARPHEQVGVRP